MSGAFLSSSSTRRSGVGVAMLVGASLAALRVQSRGMRHTHGPRAAGHDRDAGLPYFIPAIPVSLHCRFLVVG